MFDINFYMKAFELKKKLMAKDICQDRAVWEEFEGCRSKEPVVYNIETTNACNMRCEMCPRTTMMTRPVATMDMDTFKNVVRQIKPFTDELWNQWKSFVREKYKIAEDEMSENHFFLYVIPKVTVLHGYGDPLLDKDMPQRIRFLTGKKITSYFSCNPANINISKMEEMFENGLGYVKFSIESVDDFLHKQIRGNASNFTDSYSKILKLLELKKRNGYKTTIVITMLDLKKDWQGEEFKRLKDAFKGQDVYIYLKSQDQKWYQGKQHPTQSIHWTEFCQFPWSSMTIKSDGFAVQCVEDFNNEIILGDAKSENLYDIWNSERYRQFRYNHFNLTPGIKCTGQCDMVLVGDLLQEEVKNA